MVLNKSYLIKKEFFEILKLKLPRKNFQANFFLILCEKIRHEEKYRIS